MADVQESIKVRDFSAGRLAAQLECTFNSEEQSEVKPTCRASRRISYTVDRPDPQRRET
jgi:hypothetical protein